MYTHPDQFSLILRLNATLMDSETEGLMVPAKLTFSSCVQLFNERRLALAHL